MTTDRAAPGARTRTGARPGDRRDAAGAAAAPQGARMVVVEGRSPPAAPDPHAPQRARRAVERRLLHAALHSARDHVAPLAAVLVAWAPLAAWGSSAPWWQRGLWALATLLVAGLMIRPPARVRPWRRGPRVLALALLLCGVLLWPVVVAAPAWQGALAAAAVAFGIALAAALAPLWPATAVASALPLAVGLAVATAAPKGDAAALPWFLLGALGSALAWLLAYRRRRLWRQSMRALIARDERARAVEAERDAAWRADEEKSRFLAIASHDLRQPVHALGLFAATLQRRLAQSPDAALARNLVGAVDGLERSFNALLDVSKLDAGAVVPQPQTFALRDTFRRLQMQFGGQAELAGLGLRFATGGRSVTTDPQLLERILGNLIQNAVKYTEHGGIVVVARGSAHHTNIEVWDTGCGIRPEQLPHVFDEFFQVGRGERDRSHGLGMGLAIVKRLAAVLGHRLEVASVPGRGTMFRIGVPVGDLHPIEDEVAPVDTVPMTIDHAHMVLVVDDEEAIREGLRLLLQEWGYQVMTAGDAVQAEAAVSALEGHIDLVLTDLHLGAGADGQEVIAMVRRLCAREVPAILVTGETARARLQRVASTGDPVLFKPLQPRQLFDAMEGVLRAPRW